MHEIKRVIEHRITILMFNHIVILQRILKSFIKSKFDSTRFFPVHALTYSAVTEESVRRSNLS